MTDDAAELLHRLTSYAPEREWTEPLPDERIVQDLQVNDMDRFPWFYKRYDDALPVVPLPAELPASRAAALDVLAGTAQVVPGDLDLGTLARLLYLSAGIVRMADRNGHRYLFRAAGSAGARFPMEVYVAVPEGGRLPAGVHWYHPEQHALVQIAPPPVGDVPTVVVTGVPWRTGWRYRERGYRHIYWDTGTMLAQLLALAESAGLPARLYSRFPDAAVAELVGADGVHEFPVAVVALGAAQPALTPTGPAASAPVDRDPVEFPLVTMTQHAGDVDALGDPWPAGSPVSVPATTAETVESVITRRGSQRRMNAAASVSRELLETCMAVGMRGIDVPHWVAVHNVDGLARGLYRWPDLDRPQRRGDLREELHFVALEQGLARDAAFVVIAAGDVAGLDARQYREAQLAAGLVEGRLHLLAYALGASASGMTFLDSEIPALLGEPLEALLFTCVGVPEYVSAAAGTPGQPSSVRIVMPR